MSKLEDARTKFDATGEALDAATNEDPDKPVLLLRAVVGYLRASGDLAVTALEKLAEIEATRRATAVANENSIRRLTWGIFAATAVYAGTTVWHELRSLPPAAPPVVNVAPGAVNVSPTINVPAQAPERKP